MMPTEYRSPQTWNGMPLINVALGCRDASGRFRAGYAHGVIAIGTRATGIIALGVVAIGVVAFGVVAVGVVAAGVVALGLVAMAVAAVGVVGIGVVAVGLFAIGVVAVGLQAIGVVVARGTHCPDRCTIERGLAGKALLLASPVQR